MAFNPSYNILDKDTHNTLVEALKSGGIGYTEADGTVHKISDTYASGGGGGTGGGFDAIIKGEQVDEAWVYTLLSGTYSAVKAKLATGIPYVLIGTYTSEEAEGIQMVGYSEIQIGAIMLATYTGGECLMIGAGGALYWLPDDTISEQLPEPPK